MNILIRTNSSSRMGIGHVMRDLVLAKKYNDANVIFACENCEGNINQRIIDEGFPLKLLKTNKKEELIELINMYSIDLLIIDNYDIDYKYEKEIKKETNVKILCFDDTYEEHYCDIVLNNSISANKKRYKTKVPFFCEIRVGLKYSLLRDEFLSIKKNRRKLKKTTKIFLSMGGVDHSNINIKILEVLKKKKNIEVNVVTSSSNKNLKKLQLFVKKNKFVKLHVNSNNIAKLLNSCDIAIVTPSVTISEVMALLVPFISIQTASNQNDIAKFLIKKRFLVIENFNKKDLDKKLRILQNKYVYLNIFKKIKRLTNC